jgi:hypothetical protein
MKEGRHPHLVAHACHPSTREAKAGGSQIQGHPGLPFLKKKKKIPNNNKIILKVYKNKKDNGSENFPKWI